MVVNEIRTAVVDMINFIIPPFVKLAIAIFIANYVTYGYLTHYWLDNMKTLFSNTNISNIQVFIDKLSLSSVIPVLFILLLVALAYSINRITGFVGSLIPFSFITNSQLVHHFETKIVWTAFPSINSIGDLELKINQLVEKIKVDNTSPYISTLKWNEEKMGKEFSYLNFIYFSTIFAVICEVGTKKYLASIVGAKLFVVLFICLIAACVIFFRIAYYHYRIQEVKLMLVGHWLKSEKNFLGVEYGVDKGVEKRIEDALKYNKKWWSVTFGYQIDWITMYRFYKFRPPFYSVYMKWKYEKNMRKKL